ncbi:MAG: molybdopterin molybdotransferase MoeA [archaeon]|jgi:molybdopterin molybdotransferase|nr:molybdopterin molybdotransferase MoeA [archaeon]
MAELPYYIPVDEALNIVHSFPLPTRIEHVGLDHASGRVLATELKSNVNDPPFDNSSMDGFACSYDGQTVHDSYHVIGLVQAAKDEQTLDVKQGEAVRIMTGAPLPDGCNAIIPIEQTETIDETTVRFLNPPKTNFVRYKGENIKQGDVGLTKGTYLGPAQLGMCATMGYATVPVFERFRIGILSTGDELKPPGEPLAYGEIYESNSFGLASLVQWLGHESKRYPAVHDSKEALVGALDVAAAECDLILTSGGVSMGEFDHVRHVMEEQGDLKFWRVKIRPGSPPLFGFWKGTPIFGLPGNPVSSHVVFRMIVAPYVRSSLGSTQPIEQKARAKVRDIIKGTADCLTLRRVILKHTDEGYHAFQPKHQGSGNLDSLSAADGLTLLPPGHDPNIDEWIDVLVL